ncbi:protein eiger isoform X2 [Drosophila hydei]|uniref:Protein eiger isoform X2 n=1 Tax=Drosophila hydei TaxID=7224 RepID=A0A6J1LWK2_DROHY|nr:protein eiger isoform X2 [Drosophila hydei]
MTAETLKPFITPTSAVNNFPAKQSSVTHSTRKSRQLIPIVLSIVALVLVALIFSLTIWQKIRVRQLDNDLGALRREVDSLRKRLGINYLDEFDEFQNVYTDMLTHDPSKLDELEGDEDDEDNEDEDVGVEDDEDDADSWNVDVDGDEDDLGNERTDYDEYLDLINQEKGVTQPVTQDNSSDKSETAASTSTSSSSSSGSNDDNVFEDFISYNDSKKKRERKTRSIADLRNELPSNELDQIAKNQTRSVEQTKESTVTPNSNTKQHSLKQRPRTRQSRQRLLVRKAKFADFPAASRAAAHFHLNRKVPQHESSIQLQSYQGDMYMGHATASSDNQWQQHFSVQNGILTVHQTGLYYVYAQICYNNTHDQNGFIIFHNNNAFLQCLNTVPTNMPKVHTCHTGGLIHLQQHESIHLRDIHRDRNVMLRDSNNRSFFGIIKL